jgi:single-strand DNA-binding protein
LIGNLGKDPESRFTPKGSKVCSFSLAANRRWKSSAGEVKEATDWFNVEAWGRLGEICQSYLHKGSLVYIEGRLRTNRYEHEGETRYFTKVIALQMQMLDRKVEEEPPVEEEDDIPLD